MSGRLVRKFLAAVGVAIAMFSVMGAASASASGVLSQWYPSYHECQYAGNVYAQRGVIPQLPL